MDFLSSLGSVGGVAGGLTAGTGSLIGGLFGKKKLEQQSYNKPAQKLLEDQVSWIRSDNPIIESGLADYGAATQRRIGETRRLAGLAEGDFADMIATGKSYDPVLTHNRLLESQTGALKDIMGNARDAGRREDSLALAALGRGGAPSRGSYERALLYDRNARQFAPQFGNIVANLPGVYGLAEQSRLGNIDATTGLIDRRTGTADYGAGLELQPGLARLAIRDAQTGNVRGVVDASRANTAGWQQKGNFANQLGDAMQSAGSYLMAGSSAGGGGGGMPFGGGGGAGLSIPLGELGQLGVGYSGMNPYNWATVPQNWYSLSPAERANLASYSAMVRQGVPSGFQGE